MSGVNTMAIEITMYGDSTVISNNIGFNPNGIELNNNINKIIVLCDTLYVFNNHKQSEAIYERKLNEDFNIVVRGSNIFSSKAEYDNVMKRKVIIMLVMIILMVFGFISLFYFNR